MFERILYTSLIDISLPNGPGVNERVFLKDMMNRLGEDFLAVIPTPSQGLPPSLRALHSILIPVGSSARSRRGWLQLRVRGTFTLPRAMAAFRPDLVVMRVGAFSLPHYVVARARRVPYVLKTAGDVTFRRFSELHSVGGTLRHINRLMSKTIWLGAACIDLVSEDKRQQLLDVYPLLDPRVHVIDNGVDLEDFQLRDATDMRSALGFTPANIVVGFVGNFPMRRGGKEVIDSVAALHESAPIKGLIVGDTGQAAACKEYAQERGVAESVLVYGEADYTDVPMLMACMDLGLSILKIRERVASEQKVRQYLASGLCVVGTAGSNDFLRGHPFARIVQSEDPAEVVEAVSSLVSQGRPTLAELRTQARALAESSLSITSKNDERIRIWGEAVQQVTDRTQSTRRP